jgi:hypothetical protein
VYLKINGKTHYLWRAVDQDGNVLDILVQSRRNKQTAKRFLRKFTDPIPDRESGNRWSNFNRKFQAAFAVGTAPWPFVASVAISPRCANRVDRIMPAVNLPVKGRR